MTSSAISDFLVEGTSREKLTGVLLGESGLAHEVSIPRCFEVTELEVNRQNNPWEVKDIYT